MASSISTQTEKTLDLHEMAHRLDLLKKEKSRIDAKILVYQEIFDKAMAEYCKSF